VAIEAHVSAFDFIKLLVAAIEQRGPREAPPPRVERVEVRSEPKPYVPEPVAAYVTPPPEKKKPKKETSQKGLFE
jgi:hypothetical protein